MRDQDHHFYASSVCTWIVTNSNRNLLDLLKHMESEGNVYNLFYVPVPHDSSYQIRNYQPEVEGAIHLGIHYPKPKKARAV
jgi:hypothetical protein